MKQIEKGRVIERIKRTPSVESFRVKPDELLDFVPGQFLRLVFDRDNLRNKDLNKYLSFSSSPDRDYIEVTKRLSNSSFSQRLRSLEPGKPVSFKAPLGNCTYKKEYRRIAFLIGGIGITPVISIIEYIVENNTGTNVTLLYSNRTEEEIIFYPELQGWSSKNNNINITYTVTDTEPADKDIEFGLIDKDMVTDKIKDFSERIFFIFGPPAMCKAMKDICIDLEVAQENIKTEQFIGY